MIDDPKLYVDIAWKAGVVLSVIYTWWSNREKATRSAIDRVEERVVRLEEDLRHRPSGPEITELRTQLGSLHSDLQELVGSFRGVQRAVDLMHQHLLQRSDR